MRRPLTIALIGPSAWMFLLASGFVRGPARADSPPSTRSTAGGPATLGQSPGATGERVRAGAQAKAQAKPEKEPDVIFVPTPPEVVEKMMEMAGVKKTDVHYDLGCGDGRVVVAAAKRGARSIGIDIDPVRIAESLANVKKNRVEDRATIKKADIFEADLADASVVTLYLLPDLNVRLMPKLKKLRPGTRIVSHDFDMRGAKPKMVATVKVDDEEEEHTVYLWVVPWEEEKP